MSRFSLQNTTKSQSIPHIAPEDMPTWMRQSAQPADWGVLLVIGLSLLLAWPFLLQNGLPRTNDTESYVYRTADYAQSIREGYLYPRWSAAVRDGYGAPIPQYYPPGAPYTAALMEVLFTNNTLTAIRLVYALSMILAGSTLYTFVMRWAGPHSAFLAAVLYVYSPYLGLNAPHIIGDLPSVMALGLLPTLLWSVHRLLTRNQIFDFTLVVLVSCGLLLTAPPHAAVGATIALLLAGWHVLVHPNKWRALWVPFALSASGALASFYWIPGYFEQEGVMWFESTYSRLSQNLNLTTLISPLQPIDLNELTITPQFTLGLGLIALSIIGVISIITHRAQRGLYSVMLLAGCGLGAVALFVYPGQPWLLGPLTLCWAVIGGAAMRPLRWLLPQHLKRLDLPILLAFALSLGLPVWLPPLWADTLSEVPTPADQILHEQQGFGVAVLPPGSPVPLTIPAQTLPDLVLVSSYQAGIPERIPLLMGQGTEISRLQVNTHSESYIVRTDETITLDVLRAYFPGWRATLDGTPIELDAHPTTGLMEITIPPTDGGTLHIYLGMTPLRRTAWAITWITLILVMLAIPQRLRNRTVLSAEYLPMITTPDARLLAILLTGFTFSVLFFGNPESPYTLHSRPGYRLDDTMALRNPTNVGIEALSYDLNKTNFTPGETLELFISWRTARPLLRNYGVQVWLQDADMTMRWQTTSPRYLAGYPSRRWPTNRYVSDHYKITISSGIQPGTYQIALALFPCIPTCQTNAPVTFFDTNGMTVGTVLLLPSRITINR